MNPATILEYVEGYLHELQSDPEGTLGLIGERRASALLRELAHLAARAGAVAQESDLLNLIIDIALVAEDYPHPSSAGSLDLAEPSHHTRDIRDDTVREDPEQVRVLPSLLQNSLITARKRLEEAVFNTTKKEPDRGKSAGA